MSSLVIFINYKEITLTTTERLSDSLDVSMSLSYLRIDSMREPTVSVSLLYLVIYYPIDLI